MKNVSAPYFSVVVPFYNRSHLLASLLASLDEQIFRDFEVVIVNDGSSDGFEDVPIPEGRNLKVISQPNAGGGAARNAGIKAASGRFVAFLDSDDGFLPEKLQKVYSEIQRSGATFVYSYAKVYRGNNTYGRKPDRGLRNGERFDEYALAARQPTQTSTLVIEKNLALDVLFDERLKKFQDIDFCLRLARAGAKISFVEEELTIWNDSVPDGRIGNKKRPDQARYFIEKHKRHLTKKAVRGFYSNIYSYEASPGRLLFSAYWILNSIIHRDISLKRGLHSLVRAIVPQAAYRKIVDALLKV